MNIPNNPSASLKKALGYFIQGALLVTPLAITIYVIVAVFQWIDQLLNFKVPGLGILILTASITLIGYFTSTIVEKSVVDTVDRFILKIPLVNLVYTSVKDLIGAFVGEKKKFKTPVLVQLNKENNLYRIGFITQHDLSEIQIKDKVAVYLPHSYNISGNLYIVPKENIQIIDGVPSSQVMKFIVSGGVSDLDSQVDSQAGSDPSLPASSIPPKP
ncbi:DUF502 domain-containing protein [Rapidithrix thailandica]|uniref:DUF502 domain-containing protein n=1 Tax=Rapidithrix thailandica TaxID=413964 RepID=A0AAW9S898_9BACT